MDFHMQDIHFTTLPKNLKKRDVGPFQFTDEELDTAMLANWTPEMVAQHLLNVGFDLEVCEKFVENDINGPILMKLELEHLKELGISSFGLRHQIWGEIGKMKGLKPSQSKPEGVQHDTDIDEEPDRRVRKEIKRKESSARRGRPRVKVNDVVTPLESVSIVGIEQVIPKPHKCSKGDKCPRNQRVQKMVEQFKKEHPFVHDNGIIMIAGDPGNPETAEAIPVDEAIRPVSDAVPSVVASSDVMGPGEKTTIQYLKEATLRAIPPKDPQDRVRQYLDLQRQQLNASSEVPPTPPFEITSPPPPVPHPHGPVHARLQNLPKLSIPQKPTITPPRQESPTGGLQPRSARPASQVIPSFRELTPTEDEATPTPTQPVYRFGTPFSDMDVPVTMQQIPPVSRDISQSVPPDMTYRHNFQAAGANQPRSTSRNTIRRPSFPVMPALDENGVLSPTAVEAHQNTTSPSSMGNGTGIKRSQSVRVGPTTGRLLQPPPRVQYPWTQTERPTMEKAIPPGSSVEALFNGSNHSASGSIGSNSSISTTNTASSNGSGGGNSTPATSVSSSSSPLKALRINGRLSPITDTPTKPSDLSASGEITYAGLMRKRKTKMLRHEWHEHFFMLRGTRLTMHKDKEAAMAAKTLEYIDIDDYAIACSTAATSRKLNAAIKAAMHLRGDKDKDKKEDVAAFSFQLIPQNNKEGKLLKKRESNMPGSKEKDSKESSGSSAAPPPPIEGAVNGTGKTHHFAVKSREERIDWMRELMLAKARKQKGEGFEVSVNGNMI